MRRFLDTNVFLYAFLNQNVSKKKVAVKIIADAIKSKDGCVSLQVVNEFCNVMVKKSGKPLLEILEAIKLFQHLPMIDSSLVLTQRALKIKDLYGIQFYDSLMLAVAESANCNEILTEDLNDGQVYGAVKAANPFKGL